MDALSCNAQCLSSKKEINIFLVLDEKEFFDEKLKNEEYLSLLEFRQKC
jgi:hypothetical protein